MKYHSLLHTWQPQKNERVLIRADLNVPISDGTVLDDFRIRAIYPTLDLIQQRGVPFTLLTHIGRPTKPDAALSTQHLLPYLKQYQVQFAPDMEHACADTNANLILENLRFFPEEKAGDPAFAEQLSTLGTFYVNDAFATLHRTDASIAQLPTFFEPTQRTFGLLVEKELTALSHIFETPKHPICLILGGGKGMDKLELLSSLLNVVDVALIGPALSLPMTAARDATIDPALVNPEEVAFCRTIIADAQQKNVTLVLPIDYQVAEKDLFGALSHVNSSDITPEQLATSIGPRTIETFSTYIAAAGTVLINGCIGFNTRMETLEGMGALLRAIEQSSALSVVSGGNSVAAARQLGLVECVDHLSTGGGSTLAFIGKHALPGLQALGITL